MILRSMDLTDRTTRHTLIRHIVGESLLRPLPHTHYDIEDQN